MSKAEEETVFRWDCEDRRPELAMRQCLRTPSTERPHFRLVSPRKSRVEFPGCLFQELAGGGDWSWQGRKSMRIDHSNVLQSHPR